MSDPRQAWLDAMLDDESARPVPPLRFKPRQLAMTLILRSRPDFLLHWSRENGCAAWPA
jgi:hypothetical protein